MWRTRTLLFLAKRHALACLCLGVSTLLVPAAQSTPEISPLTASDLAGSLRILGLSFSEREQTQMLPVVQRHLDGLLQLRLASLPDADAPVVVFDPKPRDWAAPPRRLTADWEPPAQRVRPASDDDLAFLPIAELAGLIRARQVSSEELTRLCLARLRRFGPALRCVVTLTEERALSAARRADAETASGQWRGPLHGIPYGAKDLLAATGYPTTWGAAPFTNQVLAADATVIERLEKAGAVLVAKLSLGELAMGDVWFGGRTRNPWQPEKGSSGSSAGSAAAVAAGLVPFALGSETLGSIVSPSTVCGVTGLRPTFGRVPRTGAMALCWSLDKLGPIARSAQDCALVLDVIQGEDGRDPACEGSIGDTRRSGSASGLRLGVLQGDLEADTQNRSNHLATLARLESLGFTLRPVQMPDLPTQPLWLILHAEAATAFDGFTRENRDDGLAQQADGSWPNQFRSARLIPAVEYLQANRLRRQFIEAMHRIFQDVDVVVAPPWAGRSLLISNMTGHPCVIVPNGDKSEGSPAGICFLAGLHRDHDALAVAEAYQAVSGWHRQRPPLDRLASP